MSLRNETQANSKTISSGSAQPINFGADKPSKMPPPLVRFQKIIAKRTEQRLKRNDQLLNTAMPYFDKLVQKFL